MGELEKPVKIMLKIAKTNGKVLSDEDNQRVKVITVPFRVLTCLLNI